MNENVKINIFERDNTAPAGSGIDSTDIAFIPGFSSLTTAPKNKPTLITSTREFEQLFGKQPRVLTTRDITTTNGTIDYSKLNFSAGDFDRSYVFAKELLYQGMPVLYSNIVADDFYTAEDNWDAPKFVYKNEDDAPPLKITPDTENKVLRVALDGKDSYTGNVTLCYNIPVDINPAENNIPSITTYECAIAVKNNNTLSEILCYVEAAKGSNNALPANCKFTHPGDSDSIIEIINTGDAATIQVTVTAQIPVSLNADDIDNLEIVTYSVEPNKSILDGFYYSDKSKGRLIDKQWGVGEEDTIADKSIYSVKYITSGGYPAVIDNFDKDGSSLTANGTFASKMLAAASERGDAVALIDYQLNSDIKTFDTSDTSESFYTKMHKCVESLPSPEYGAAMYPWALYNCTSTLNFTKSTMISMPASFAYLMCVAKAIKSSPNWLAMAGVTRGIVPAIDTLLVRGNVLSNTIAEEMQPKFGVEGHKISINTITNIRPYGLTLWGNRTLKAVDKEGTTALNFLNTRNMLSDIKKLLYTSAKSCMFEQNTTDLWMKFKNGVEPLLRRLEAGNGIEAYRIVRGTTKYNGDPLNKGEVAAVIQVYPMYATEYFELAVEINDQDVTVS